MKKGHKGLLAFGAMGGKIRVWLFVYMSVVFQLLQNIELSGIHFSGVWRRKLLLIEGLQLYTYSDFNTKEGIEMGGTMLFHELVIAKINHLWSGWSIEFLVLANFIFQAILTVTGSRRRNTPRGTKLGMFITGIVWFAYLSSAKIATVVLGKLMTIDVGRTERNTHAQLQALLAPLVLMQLGNPDTITAYSIEDNQLGARQVFIAVLQVGIIIYILVRSWTDSKVSLLYLSMSVAGILKYGETSWALKSALYGNFGLTSQAFDQYVDAGTLFDKLSEVRKELPQAKLILRAYYRFCCLKPHLENWHFYPPVDCEREKLYIDDCTCHDVFKITDSELGFMYDVLYTKAPVIYTRKGFVLRFFVFVSLIVTICGFSVVFKDAFVYNISVGFVYYVLIASVMVEVYQILRLPFSDWAIKEMIRHQKACPLLKHFLLYLEPRSASWRRWSNTMGQFNLLDFCLKTGHRKYNRIKIWDLGMRIRKRLCLGRICVSERVKELVVEELKEVQKIKERREFTERGNWTIRRYQKNLELEDEDKLIEELNRILGRPFDKSIFIWHITTNVLYHSPRDDTVSTIDIDAIMHLSNYMMYLLVTRSHVLSTTTGHIIFNYSHVKLAEHILVCTSKQEYCKKLLNLSEEEYMKSKEKEQYATKVEDAVVGKWHLLRDVKELANSLLNPKLSDKNRWGLIGSMWVEMLGFAASNCDMEYHSEHIKQGGELITHVWLLIAHTVTKNSYSNDGESDELITIYP